MHSVSRAQGQPRVIPCEGLFVDDDNDDDVFGGLCEVLYGSGVIYLLQMDVYFKRERLVPITIYSSSIFPVFPGDGASVFTGENKEIKWE